jgi:ankyrin repeat protein
VAVNQDLAGLLTAIGAGDRAAAAASLEAAPGLATARLARRSEFFLEPCRAQVYEGATALHAAAFAYDRETAADLMARGADLRARDRRGSEPLHAAVTGGPGAPHWNPARQRAVIEYLIEAGADPDAAAVGGVTPLHRAVRNRCSAAVEALLRAGADPRAVNDRGSDPAALAHWTTGRPGAGSAAARAEQELIIGLLRAAGG